MDDRHPIQGYVNCGCGCGELVLEHVAWQTGGVAFGCFVKGRMVRLHEVEIINRGRRISAPVPRKVKSGRKHRGSPETRRKTEAARRKAAFRLAMLYPDIFDVLYAEERVKLGLNPPVRRERNTLVTAVETNPTTLAYAAQVNPGETDA